MMVNWNLVGAMFLPNVGGWVGAVTMAGKVKKPDGTAWYQTIRKPTWTPPDWVFGPAWTVLYCAMGAASYLVYKDCGGFTKKAILPLSIYGGQLILNWTWTPVFFGCHKIGLAFYHIIALDATAAACTVGFFRVNKQAGYFMLPYLAWLGYATCLNYAIWRLNPEEKVEKKPEA